MLYFGLMEEMTVSEYAKTVNLSRLGVYKQIRENRLPENIRVKKYLGRIIIMKNGKKK